METNAMRGSVTFTQDHYNRIKTSLDRHYQSCALYRSYCDNVGFSPASFAGVEDIQNIPLIPTQMFKTCDILSVPEEAIVKVCTSSGTKGSVSKVPRDAETLQSFTVGTAQRIGEALTASANEYTLMCLGPEQEEARDLWIAYIMSLLGGVTAKQAYYVKGGKFLLADVIEDLKRAEQTGEKLAIIGPPMFFVYLSEEIKKSHTTIRINPESFVITMGGWKKDEQQALSRADLEKNALEALGLAATQFRDGYGAVELNSVVFDCMNKHKHLPDWVVAVARDPDTFKPLPYGEEGILSFIDTSASSYPCFILTEDFGAVYPARSCACGVTGDYVKITRRINTVESKGCALKMNTTEVEKKHA